MAILIRTKHAQSIICRLKEQINNNQIPSWAYDDDGDFMSMDGSVVAWMRPVVKSNRLDFYVIGRKDMEISIEEYAVFHSRFVEMLLTYFFHECTYMLVTSPFVNENDTKNIQSIWQLH